MPSLRFESAFETIYSTDLVYAPDCWKLCGDAHCCNFRRYKSQMSILGKQHFQELPLLPGEIDFLRARGWLDRFANVEHRRIEFPLRRGVMKIDLLIGRSDICACSHDTRTAACRLYPLLPVFDTHCKLIGADARFGFYEEIEAIGASPRACKIENVPFGELNKFLNVCTAIAEHPTMVFYLMAYRLAKAHAAERLRSARQSAPSDVSTLRIFEGLFALKQLIDVAAIRQRLDLLADEFSQRYEDAFQIS